MQTIARSTFTTVKTEGGLLPADLLQRIADGRAIEGLRPEDYHLLPGERLNEAINRAWNRCLGAWLSFDEQRRKLPAHDSGVTLTRERWLLVFFQELGYGRLQLQRGGLESDDSTTFPISHVWEQTPIHLVSFRQELDRRGESGTARNRSPHSLVQEFLNRSAAHTWAILSNGLQLRLVHDNASLRRAAYVEFDLAAIMSGELYADFSLLWLVCHQSRVEALGAGQESNVTSHLSRVTSQTSNVTDDASLVTRDVSWLDRWSQLAAEQGTRALDALRDGVQEAIETLGRGFLRHPANGELRANLRSGELTAQDFYDQLRRLVYRIIFLAVAEERDLLLLPDATGGQRQNYERFFSLRRLRNLAADWRGSPHPDLYRQVRLLFTLLATGYAPLGLPGLGSFLFSPQATPALDDEEIANRGLLGALRGLLFATQNNVRLPVDYRNLDAEELGSVYESLLDLHPQVNMEAGHFALAASAGSERKTTGSYYTPSQLIDSLLESALEPVVADRLAEVTSHASSVTSDSSRMTRDSSRMTRDSSRMTPEEAAILSIKVIDPACGSGHFLIAAARRLAHHLARVRTGDEEPAPDDLRAATREVARRCLYGVDLNQTAVELCKVALWMETLEPGKPLSFLDANIQCGNSLVGVFDLETTAELPDDAFQPVTGDDKATAAELRRRNKQQRAGQLDLFGPEQEKFARIGDILARRQQRLVEMPEQNVADAEDRARAFAELTETNAFKWGRLAADLWTAAFFWPLNAQGSATAPTHGALRRLRGGQTPAAETRCLARELAQRHGFLHWPLAFPDVFQRTDPGFDVVLGNPPWERVKLQEKEWFAARHPAITAAPNAAARKRMIDELRKEDPALHDAFQSDLAGAEKESAFLRRSGRFPLCGRGDVNTYAVFAELARQLLRSTGRAGVITPTGIATDDTTKFYFQEVMESGTLASLYDFENRRKIFQAVDSRMKFCLLTLRGETLTPGPSPAGRGAAGAEFVFFALDVDDLRDPERRFSLTAQEIALLNPNTRTCPIFRSKRDAELTKAIYRRVPVLIKEGPPEENPWGVSFLRMIDMSNDSHLFHTRAQLEQAGWRLEGNRFVRGGEVMLPLYEAKMLHQFDHRWATYDGGETRDLTLAEKQDPQRVALPRYWVDRREVEARLPGDRAGWFVAFRDITNTTNERTAIFSVIPRVGVGNNAPLALFDTTSTLNVELFATCLSSLALDYAARFCVGGTHMNFFILKQLPVLLPNVYTKPCPWNDPMTRDSSRTTGHESRVTSHKSPATVADWLLPRVLELTYTAWDLQSFARDCGYDGPPFRWDEERRFLLRCELDAAYFHLYGIARDDVDYIMETFPIVKRKDMARHGEYRTKRVILEIYDALAEAMQGGAPYQTRLSPPPADPLVAHDA